MNIKVRNLCFLLLCASLILSAQSARAQECETIKEQIITLKRPLLGTPAIWNAFYGQEEMDQIADVVPAGDGTFVVVGSYTKNKNDSIYKPFMAKLDSRGRIIWEKRQDTKQHKSFEAVHKRAEGFAGIGDVTHPQKGRGFYLGVYDDDGARVREIPVYEAGYALNALAFAPSQSGESYIVSATREAKGKKEAVLYKITLSGRTLWRRQYSPGLATQFHTIHLADDGNYTLAGEIEIERGRTAGWIARLDGDGTLLWQKMYPRGREAAFLSAHTHQDQSITVSGKVRGFGEDKNAAWVLKVDPRGFAMWQRYYQGRTGYSAPGLIGYADGRASVLIDGVKYHENDRGHVSLLTLSPRGRLMDVESFSDGHGAQGVQLKAGNYQERVVVGYAQSVKLEEEKDEMRLDASPYTFDGWIFAATALDPYEDPCVRRY